MTRADLREITAIRAGNRVGLGAFNFVQLDIAEAIVQAAVNVDIPVVLQISENAVKYHGALAPLARAAIELAGRAPVPVVVHLDHAESPELIHEAVRLGFDSVMFDGSRLPYSENERVTADVVHYCHSRGVAVEAELGEIGGKNGVHDPWTRTSPTEAATFIKRTDADLLAVAVGSSHAMRTADAVIDSELIAEIHRTVPVPLVLHGSSGVNDFALQQAIRSGITKMNMSTRLNGVFTSAVSGFLAENPSALDPREYFRVARDRVREEVEYLLQLFTGMDFARAG